MEYDNQKITEELFPNFSSFDRAVKYPYFAPDYSFSFYNGKFVKGICNDLANRIPILSVGSNRSPYQLKRKFSLTQNICVTPAILIDSDIVYAASLSAYGSMPATQWPSKGTKVKLNVLWLSEEQLNIMHLTEAIGVAYDFVKLDSGSVKIRNFNYEKQIYAYVAISGVFAFDDCQPKRLSAINAKNVNLQSISEYEALTHLKNKLGFKNEDLSKWIRMVVKDKSYRLRLHNSMRSISVKPKNPNWEIVNITSKGELIL